MKTVSPLAPDQLYRHCDEAALDFETTDQLKPLDGVLGQDRALEALGFGTGMTRDGYNLYALGPPGLGKHRVVRAILDRRAEAAPVPPDWCYVNNFADLQRPTALSLPAGTARAFRDEVQRLVQDLRAAIPAALDSDEFRARRDAIEEEVKEQHEPALEALQKRAQERGIALIRTPAGFGFAPVREGEVINPEVFQGLPEEERKRIEHDVAELQNELQTVMRRLPALVKESRRKLRELIREITRYTAAHLIDEARQKYADQPRVAAFFDALAEDVVDNADAFMRAEEATGAPAPGQPTPAQLAEAQVSQRYAVNLLVGRDADGGAPVIYEDNPTYQHLIGEIEHLAQMGTLVTDFTLIKAGALHRANGGYLILDARRLLTQPLAYDALKQALRGGRIRIESPGQALSLVSTRSLEPEPIPLAVKVVLIGDGMLYYTLSRLDPDFDRLFKVAADFDDRVEWTPGNALLYARLIADLARLSELRPLDRPAVARVLEHGARLVGDTERLSMRIESIGNLLREADYWCGEAGRPTIAVADIERAIEAQRHRANRVEQRMREEITRGTIVIETTGAEVGQINGLAVIQLGAYAFGRPSRITARVRLGKGEVVDIEREVALGGPLHSKGMLILAGFLGARFAGKRPLALAASLVFEQSYGGIDGDSASSAELYALLSALAEAPIRQSLAVTGSVSQRGEVQAIGGVNEKIEGFFDLCRARGLDGDHGVLIPATNVKHLMLRADVVAAVADGKFHIYPIAHVDQGIEVLTGIAAGARDAKGAYPKGSINQRVDARLQTLAEAVRAFAAEARGGRAKPKRKATP